MRESAMYDRLLMEGMIQQTLASISHLAGALELAGAGMGVFDDPKRWGAIVQRTGSSKMAFVERHDVLYVYSMGNASTNDLKDTNAFIAELVRIVERYQPLETWVTAFTRLLRSASYTGALFKAFTENTKILHCEADIDVSSPEGQMLFQMLAMMASMERDYIVRRHTAGRVAQWRRGEWIPNSVPPGYRLAAHILVLDEPSIDRTRRMLSILGNTALGPSECLAQIGALGVVTTKLKTIYGDSATLADARNPSDVINSLAGWVELYATGRYDMLWPNKFPGIDHVAGLDVERVDGFEHGALRLTFEVPVPPGGWADDATLEGIRRRYASCSATGGASHVATPPLSTMFAFDDGVHEYALLAGGNNTYELSRRPLLADRPFSGWKNSADDREQVGRVHRDELHRSIAHEVVAAVRSGLPAELDAQRFQVTGPLPRLDGQRAKLRALRRQLDETSAGLERARRNAALAGDDAAAALFVEDVKSQLADRTRLKNEIDILERGIAEPVLGQQFESSTELVAHAIAALGAAGTTAHSAMRDALRTIITKERYWIESKAVHWELFIDLPHPDGTVTLGPISGELPNRLRASPGHGRRHQRAAGVSDLVELGLTDSAARSAAACPDPMLLAVLTAHLENRPLPADAEAEWAAHVIDVYTDVDFSWNQGHWRLADAVRRRALSILSEAGGTLDRQTIIDAGLTESQLRYLTRNTDAPSGDPILTRSDRRSNTTFSLLNCPHCHGHADHSVVTPETRPGIVCSTCWRAPTPTSPIFPTPYRTTSL